MARSDAWVCALAAWVDPKMEAPAPMIPDPMIAVATIIAPILALFLFLYLRYKKDTTIEGYGANLTRRALKV